MSVLIYSLFNHPIVNADFAKTVNAQIGKHVLRQFPDQEYYILVEDDVKNKDIIILDSLDVPNQKILALILFCETLKDLGAKRILFMCPYLCYMRQDKRFNPGEGVTSKYFAKLISNHIDWLFTFDPHLHRYKTLSEIYTCQNQVLHAAPVISRWIQANIPNPVLIGPDSESEQWVAAMAQQIGCGYQVLSKVRHGDRHVEISLPAHFSIHNHHPVFVDDIISSATTMITAIKLLSEHTSEASSCIGIHALFNQQAYENLKQLNVKQIISCNTISHPSNQIDLSQAMIQALSGVL